MVSTFLVFFQKRSDIMSAIMLCHEMPLQSGNHQQTHQTGGETTVVQAHTAVEYRQGGDHTEVHHGCNHTIEPAVLVRNGAEAVGIAQTHHDGLGMEELGKFCPEERGQELKNMGCHSITQHDGENIGGMGTGIAGRQHAEDNAEGNAVEGRADEIVVAENEQAVHTYVHEECGVGVGSGKVSDLCRIHEKLPVIPRTAADQQCEKNAASKKYAAEGVDDGRGNQGKIRYRAGNLHAHGPIQAALDHESSHAHRQSSGIQGKVFMDGMGIVQTCRDEETSDNTDQQGKKNALQGKTGDIGIGIPEHQF